jgi:hypothetical protein
MVNKEQKLEALWSSFNSTTEFLQTLAVVLKGNQAQSEAELLETILPTLEKVEEASR